jgi:hypothetical protein
MSVIFSLVDGFMKNGLERLVHGLYLSIFLGIVRGRMTMFKPQFRCKFFHNFVLKVTSIINDNINRDSEPRNNLIEHEECSSIAIVFNCRHGLNSLGKVVYDHNNVLTAPSRSWVAIHKIQPPLGEGTDGNDWMKRGWMQENISSEHLEGVTLLNHFNIIFKKTWPKITDSQFFLGCRKPKYITTTSPTMAVV